MIWVAAAFNIAFLVAILVLAGLLWKQEQRAK